METTSSTIPAADRAARVALDIIGAYRALTSRGIDHDHATRATYRVHRSVTSWQTVKRECEIARDGDCDTDTERDDRRHA